MLPVHTRVGQGWTTNSSWAYMIVIPGNLKQQTETETGSYWDEVILTALWGDKANVAPRATLSKLGFWTFNFGGHSDIFPYIPLYFLLNSVFFLWNSLFPLLETNDKNIDKHTILKSNYIQFLPVET